METKTYITLSRLAVLLLFLSCGISLPAQTVNYTYDNAGNRTGRTVSPATNAAPSPVAFSVDTALLRQAASARQLAPDRRRRAASVRESLTGKAIGKHSDAASEAMEREHEERIAKWIAARDVARPAEQKSRASGDAAGGDRALSFSSSTPVVNIPLQEGVSPTGARTYSIPIPTAYGFPYAPAVSLSYNSQAGMGLAGYGWTVSGLSAITIADKTLYYHGVAAAAKAGDPSGAFALDGEPLVPNTVATGVTGYTLMTAQSRVLVKPTSSGGYITGFTAKYPDGSTATFSCEGADPATAYTFPIRTIENIAGEKMAFTYESYSDFGNCFFVKKIAYGYRSGSYKASLSFQYSDASAFCTQFIGGTDVTFRKKLASVTSYDGTSAIYTYQITYAQSDGADVPVSVTCSRGSSTANSLLFEYPGVTSPSPSSSALFTTESYSLHNAYDPDATYYFKRGKMVGDDFRDGMILCPAKSEYASLGGGTYGSTYSSSDVIIIYPTLSRTPQTLTAGDGFQTIEAVDVDADGKDELVKVNYGTTTSAGTTLSILVYAFNKSSGAFAVQRSITLTLNGAIPAGGGYSPFQRVFYFGDFVGNGRTQMLAVSLKENDFGASQSCAAYLVDLKSGTASTAFSLPQDLYPFDRKNTFALDIDADAKSEFCWAALSTAGISAYDLSTGAFILEATYPGAGSEHLSDEPGKTFFTDINADGLLDIVLAPEMTPTSIDPDTGTIPTPQFPTLWTFIQFTGKEFSEMHCDLSIPWIEGEELLFMDVNHDGFTDLVKLDAAGTPSVYFNRFGTFDSTPTDAGLGSNPNSHLVKTPVTDFRGMSSYIQVNDSSVKSFHSTDDALARRLVASSTDSFGVQLENGYSAPNSGGGYTDESLDAPSEGFARVKLPLRLLTTEAKRMTTGTGPGSVSSPWPSRVYRYYNLIVSTTGRGLCGFQKTSVSDVNRGTTTVFYPEAFGVPLSQTAWLAGHEGSPYASTTYSYVTWITPFRPPRLTGSTAESDLDARSVQTSCANYDEWDFPGIVTTVTSVSDQAATPGVATAITETTSTLYAHQATASCYRIGTVTSTTVSRESATVSAPSAMTTRTDYTYDAAFRPLTEKVWRNWGSGANTLLSERRISYDAFGNITSEKSAGHGATSFLEKTYTYSSDGRRLLSATDELGETTAYSDYTLLGQAGKATDYRGTTTFSFDTWGQPTGTSRPDGSSVTTSRAWGGKGLFTVTSTPSDAPKTVTHCDALGREVRFASRRFDAQWLYTDTRYDYRSRVAAVSLPHRSETVPSSRFIQRSYDAYDRITAETHPSGRTTSWTYDGSASSVTKDGITSSSLTDAAGAVWQTTDPGGTVVRWMRIDGQPVVLYSSAGGGVTSLSYDTYGDRTSISDPSGGTRTESRTWASDGSCTHSYTSPLGTVTTSIDRYGRTTAVARTGLFSTSWSYDSHGRLGAVSSTNGTGTAYSYDAKGRIASVTHSVPDGKSLTETFTYNASGGTLASTAFASQDGALTTETYTYANGWRTKTSVPGGTVVWQLTAEDDFGHPTQGVTGGLTRTYAYDALSGMPTARGITVTSGGAVLQDDTYAFNAATGNLTSRHAASATDTEYFQYDASDRLVSWAVGLYTRTAMYSALGNPTFKSGTGYYTYGTSASPFRVTGIDLAEPAAVPGRSQALTYNVLDRPETLSEGGRTAAFTYDEAGDRVKMAVTQGSAGGSQALLTRYYIGGRYEVDVTPTGAIRQRLFLGGDAYSAPAALVKDSTQAWTLVAIGRDYLGSITHLADAASGALLAEYSYDPWGRLRDPQTLAPYDAASQPELLLGDRGFTGHEHLAFFGLVNMNARLYDPLAGRFLSPDPYIQAPDNTQNLNRYSYALNNPLKYTDESGELISEYIALTIAAGISNWIMNGGDLSWKGVGYFAVGAGSSVIGGFAGAKVASVVGGYGFLRGATIGVASGFASGFTEGTANSLLTGRASLTKGLSSALGGAAIGGLLGGFRAGALAREAGGNYWNGDGAQHDFIMLTPTNYSDNVSDNVIEYSNASAQSFSDKSFRSKLKGVGKLFADGTVPPGGYTYSDGIAKNKNGQEILGASVFNGRKLVGKSDIYLFPKAFDCKEKLYLVMGHEYAHALFQAFTSSSEKQQHCAIFHWMYYQAMAFDYHALDSSIDDNFSLYVIEENSSSFLLHLIYINFPIIKSI